MASEGETFDADDPGPADLEGTDGVGESDLVYRPRHQDGSAMTRRAGEFRMSDAPFFDAGDREEPMEVWLPREFREYTGDNTPILSMETPYIYPQLSLSDADREQMIKRLEPFVDEILLEYAGVPLPSDSKVCQSDIKARM